MVLQHFGILVACVTSLACPTAAFAKKYYVAQTSNASDENSGNARKPWRTISAAVQRAKPGDQVIVCDGDYRTEDTGWGVGVIPILQSGTKSKLIRLEAAAGAKPLVFRFLLKDAAHLSISGFQYSNLTFSNLPNWQDMPCIVRDEEFEERPDYSLPWEARRAQVEAEFATYFELITTLDFQTAIELENCNAIELKNNTIDGYWAGIQCRHCDQITIDSNQISHCAYGVFAWRPAPALTNSVIRNNRISQSLDNGIDIREGSDNVLVEQNCVSYSGRSHIVFQNGVRNSKIRNNLVQLGGYYSESMEFPGSSALNIHSSGSGNSMEANFAAYQIDLTQVDGNGIILDTMTDGASATICYNFLCRNMGDGLNTTLSPNALIFGNTFVENGHNASGYRRGAGIKLSRNQDINQTIVCNNFLFNRVAGIISYLIIDQQQQIDRNIYWTRGTPLIWDGFEENDRAYRSIREVRRNTGWERLGWAIVFGF